MINNIHSGDYSNRSGVGTTEKELQLNVLHYVNTYLISGICQR